MDGKAYKPEPFDNCLRVAPVASFCTVTTAPVTTAPELSKIVPVNSEVEVWPKQANAPVNNSAGKSSKRFVNINPVVSCLGVEQSSDVVNGPDERRAGKVKT